MRRLAVTYARVVGLTVVVLSAWMVAVNVVQHGFGENTYDPPSMFYVVIGFGLVGLVGGVAFLLSWDGPDRFRSRTLRIVGWLGMLFMAMLPWSFTFIFLPLVALSGLTLLLPAEGAEIPPSTAG